MTHSTRTIALAVVCAALLASRSVPAQQAAEPRPPDLLFKASFDRLTAFADFAKGKPESTLDVSLELRAKPGIKGHCLLLEKGEKCMYQADGNVDLKAGTISFWVKPANWRDADRRYVWFFNLYGRIKGQKKYFNMSIDKSDGPSTARIVWQFGSRRRDPDYKIYVVLGKAKWEPETWHKIDATWDSKNLAIYVDGKLSNRQDLPNVVVPELTSPCFELTRPFDKKLSVRNSEDRTYIDEVEIYRGAHPADRVLRRYLADRPDAAEELPVPTATVPRVAGVRLDGRLQETAWKRASRVPIMIDVRGGFPHTKRAYASVCHDDRNVYVGLWSQKHGAKLTAEAGREGKVWMDDAFEIFLSPGEKPTPDFCQWIINSKGAWFDARGSSKAWNSDRTRLRTHVADEHWTAEVAIPFSDLGVAAPEPGQIWRATFCRNWHRPKPAHPTYTTWAYGGPSYGSRPERFGKLVFAGENGGAQLTVDPGLSIGRLSVAAAGPRRARLSVSVTSDGKRMFAKTMPIRGKTSVKAKIRDVKMAILAATIDDGAGKRLLDYGVRFLIKQPIAVSYIPDVPGRQLSMDLDLSNLDPEWLAEVQAGKATLEIAAKGPDADHTRRRVKLTDATTTVSLPFQFEEGTNELTYTLRASGRAEPFVVEDSLDVPNLDWVGSNVGVSDDVLEPWTPLEYAGDRAISCWGRRYELDGPFPSRVVNQGRNILRGPIRLALQTEKGRADLAESTRRVTRKDAHRAEFTGSAEFGKLGATVEWDSWMEYDGLAVSTFTITPPRGGLNVQSLTLRIPLRSGLRHVRGARKSPNRMNWDGKLWESAFEPILWLTDEDEGFLYFCESEANWVYPSGKPVTIVRGGPRAGIELRIISKPVTVKKPIRYQFGFQATPVKPLTPGWREHNFGPGIPIEHQTHQPWMNGYTGYDGLWDAARPKVLREFDQERRRKGVLTFYYATTSCTPNHNPMYKLFRILWNDPYPAQFGPYQNKETRFRPAAPVHHLVPVCPGAPTLVEYEVWLAKRLAEQVGARGFYTDCDGIWPCENRLHGCGFTDAFGKTGVSYTILNKRAFAKRVATLCRQIEPRGYWMTHCHSKLVPPVHCFADYFWPGEEYTHRLYGNKWYYMDTMDEVDYRAQLSCLQSGLVHVFLPEFKRGTKDPRDIEQPQPSESLLAMCAVNDVNVSAAYMHTPTMSKWWGLRKKLGLKDAAFIAYWRPSCPVKALTRRALASIYRWPGRAVVAVANRLPKDTTVRARVDLDALGLAGKRVIAIDERTGKRLAMAGGTFSVKINGRNFTFVSLAPE